MASNFKYVWGANPSTLDAEDTENNVTDQATGDTDSIGTTNTTFQDITDNVNDMDADDNVTHAKEETPTEHPTPNEQTFEGKIESMDDQHNDNIDDANEDECHPDTALSTDEATQTHDTDCANNETVEEVDSNIDVDNDTNVTVPLDIQAPNTTEASTRDDASQHSYNLQERSNVNYVP